MTVKNYMDYESFLDVVDDEENVRTSVIDNYSARSPLISKVVDFRKVTAIYVTTPISH